MHRYYPDFATFQSLSRQPGIGLVPVYRQVSSDSLTPVLAFHRLGDARWSFLFESVVGGEKPGRYSFLGADPFCRFVAKGNSVTITHADGREEHQTVADPLRALEALIEKHKAPHLPGMPRFLGGAVGHAGYDTVRWVEHLPDAPPDDRDLPDLAFALYDRMVVFDQINKTVLVVAHARAEGDPREQYEKACRQVDSLVGRIRDGATLPVVDLAPLGEVTGDYHSTFTREKFHEAVAKAKEYILAGDIFQVVLSQRLEAKTDSSPFTIYRALRVVNPSPFLFLLREGDLSLVGSSPEIMTRLEDGELTIRPLAGTRRRGKDSAEDEALATELLADPKERAEHLMLIDLARNDIGRIAQTGTVKVTDQMVIEKYSHVQHIVSNVEGLLKPDLDAIDVLRATFPAGTLTGAPKVRAMEIIDELEPVKRGIYGGACGYLSWSGEMDVAIAIRTGVLKDGVLNVQAAAGVVFDSIPEAEYQETEVKARAVLRAAELVEEGFTREL